MTFQKNKSMLCPACRKLISRSEEECPYCGMKKPGSWLTSVSFSAPFSSPENLFLVILYANIGMFVVSILLNPSRMNLNLSPFQFLSPSNMSLLLLGSTGTVPVLKLHRWWTLVSANYLHGGLLHIIFNMLALRQLAPLVAIEFGTYRMFIIYTFGGVFGFFLSVLAGVSFTIGASASLCSMIGALLYYGKSRGGTYGKAVYSQISSWAIMIIVFGFLVPGINNWGHGGGILAGAALAYLLGYHERNRESSGHRSLALICAALTLLVLLWAVINSLIYMLSR